MWELFNDGVLEECSEVCGRKMGMRSKGDTWWWNEEVIKAISGKSVGIVLRILRRCLKT